MPTSRTGSAATAAGARHRGRVEGFTLLELVVVMALVALMVALVAPALGPGGPREFRAELRDLTGVLNHARRDAIVAGRPATAVIGAPAPDAARPGMYYWSGKGEEAEWSVAEGEAAAEAGYEVTFFPEGGSTGGRIRLERGPYSALVAVDPITGRVAVDTGEPS